MNLINIRWGGHCFRSSRNRRTTGGKITTFKLGHPVFDSGIRWLFSPNVSLRMSRISFGALPCRRKKNLMTARVSLLLKSRASPDFLPFFHSLTLLTLTAEYTTKHESRNLKAQYTTNHTPSSHNILVINTSHAVFISIYTHPVFTVFAQGTQRDGQSKKCTNELLNNYSWLLVETLPLHLLWENQ